MMLDQIYGSHPLVTVQFNSSLKVGIETMQLRNIRRLPMINKENDTLILNSLKEEEDPVDRGRTG